ncbi:ATP-binding cassette domain-containing protein [Labilibaculum sp. DW002]|uniref:ATP-binding cassette domain-containing protein n=1 Tax=Paralabilibaculum antarcticum TaxID=2912572 RepID=A0ABT5VQ97_9BACT|nr:ATP-binding cassette domain-containing protein [Labilibaculum sp. DW002]MDE5417420.1 ATP-binding cassette domain-containing protein [Labilibaculum sp. DW002]
MNNQIISFTNTSIKYLNQLLLEDLNLTINKGEQWALIGASGSGKSALLNAITGKFAIAKGTLTHPLLDELCELYKEKREIVNWHQFISLVSPRHGFKNLSNTNNFYYQQRYNATHSGDTLSVRQYLSRVDPIATSEYWTYDKVIDRLQLEKLEDKHLIKLSNGETKRLLIAEALLKNPSLLLLDNPFSGLDVNTRENFNALLREVSDSGISLIMATSPYEIPDAITHIAILDEGKIVKSTLKADFEPEKVHLTASKKIDKKELQQLLSNTEQEYFEKLVVMKDIVIKYGNKTILDHINWDLKQGEHWALIGSNGAGKSTLLSLINGDNPQAYSNDIVLFDVKRGSGESVWDIKKKIGFVSPELFQYFPNGNSCLQIIESGFYDTLGLYRKSNLAKVEIAKRWMQLLEIENIADKAFKKVPASTQRLCLLARALVKNPSLLIFDEPCQGLDAHQKENFKHLTEEICKNSNVSLIYVSHYADEIPNCVQHTLQLENGKQINT